jgi:UDP-N-acetylglucosamine--N-acetylmuramyl-(pentapeptide) pyrophosphoryl-undecaprenol N-acetylglucosamine transferase
VSLRVLIAGGGTGGHVFPMVAVAAALRAEARDPEIVFVGTARGIETRVLGSERLELLDVLPLRGGGLGGFLRGGVRAAAVLLEARRLVQRIDPDVVFSVGGYAAGPVSLAARSCGVAVTLLEPNAVLGFTNRLLKPLASRAYTCFPETAPEGGKVELTGVPLRSRFEPRPYAPRDRVEVLVMGGSQGALALNEAVPRAVAACIAEGLPIDVVHQTGKDKDAEVRRLYAELGVAVRVVTFIDDVAGALGSADVVIERSGAGSLAELCAVGRAAILIPYPHAADDHQRHNAESLAKDGAAVVVLQRDATPARLQAELARLCGDAELRRALADAARRRGRPDAARTVARDLVELAIAQKRAPQMEPEPS